MLRFMCVYFSHLKGYSVTTDSKSSTVLWHRDSNSWALILVFSWEEGEKGDLGFLKPYVSTNSSPWRLSVETASRWVYPEMAVLVFRQSSIVFTSSHCYSFQEGMLIEWHVHGLIWASLSVTVNEDLGQVSPLLLSHSLLYDIDMENVQ